MLNLPLLKENDRRAIRKFREMVQQALQQNFLEMKLFGSKLHGTDVPDSDIDLLIVLKEITQEIKIQIIDIAFEVNLEHDVYISPRVLTPSMLNDPFQRVTPFIQTLEKEGVPV